MVRKTSNEALCSPFIADALVQKQYEHFSFPTSGNLSGTPLARRRAIEGGPTPESTLLGFHTQTFSVCAGKAWGFKRLRTDNRHRQNR